MWNNCFVRMPSQRWAPSEFSSIFLVSFRALVGIHRVCFFLLVNFLFGRQFNLFSCCPFFRFLLWFCIRVLTLTKFLCITFACSLLICLTLSWVRGKYIVDTGRKLVNLVFVSNLISFYLNCFKRTHQRYLTYLTCDFLRHFTTFREVLQVDRCFNLDRRCKYR